MANCCWVEMEIVGRRQDIVNFISALKQEGDTWVGRGMDASFDEILPIGQTGWCETKVYGDTKWSVQSSLINNAHNMQLQKETGEGHWGGIKKGDKTEFLDLVEACQKFNVDIELFSTEPGMKFEEHMAIIDGSLVIDDCVDMEEIDLQYFKDTLGYTKEEVEEEFGIKINQGDWDSGEYVKEGGFPDWGKCKEIDSVIDNLIKDRDYSKPERNALKENKSVSENIPVKQVDVRKDR